MISMSGTIEVSTGHLSSSRSDCIISPASLLTNPCSAAISAITFMSSRVTRAPALSSSCPFGCGERSRAIQLLYVPESQPVNATLEELRRSSLTMAIVVDEYGGMTGMVTVEDLVEQIVGNLNDEREAEYYRVLRVSPDAFLCSGRMEIGVLEEYLGITIPNTGFETAAGLVLKLAGRIPSPGEKFLYRQIQITVIQVENHTVKRLKFQLPKSKK